jgi:PAT family beta-lactamase induction signal transducer AmpG
VVVIIPRFFTGCQLIDPAIFSLSPLGFDPALILFYTQALEVSILEIEDTMNKFFRYTIFGLLYFIQGAILSYFTGFNGIYLISFGVDMKGVGLIGLIGMMPFVLKIFLGILSDRVNLFGLGYRKPYILLGVLVQMTALIVVPLVNPGTHFALYALLGFLLMGGMALYDTATDGLALDTTPPDEQGTIQGFMVGGRALGVTVISLFFGFLVDFVSWRFAFWSLAAISLAVLILAFFIRETRVTERPAFEWSAFRAFGRREILTLAILGALYSFIINAAAEIMNPFFEDKFTITAFWAGLYSAVWGLGIIFGGLLGGKGTDRLGHRRSVVVAMIVSFFAILLFVVVPDPRLAFPVVLVFGFAYGFYETVYFAASMARTDPRIAAAMFSILMAIANIGTGIGLALTGVMVDGLGFLPTFAILAALNLLALPLIPMVFKKRVLPTEAADAG